MLLYNLVTLLRFVWALDHCNFFVLTIFSLYRKPEILLLFIQYSVSCLRAHWKLFTYLIYKYLFFVNLTVYRSLTTKEQLIIMVIQLHVVCCMIKQQNFKNDNSEIG
jgi:hypothetical protein